MGQLKALYMFATLVQLDAHATQNHACISVEANYLGSNVAITAQALIRQSHVAAGTDVCMAAGLSVGLVRRPEA